MNILNCYAIVLLCGLSACAYHANHQTVPEKHKHLNISALSEQKNHHRGETQSVIFNEILEKNPLFTIGVARNVNDIVYKYIHLGMTKKEVVDILTKMNHQLDNQEHNQLYTGYFQIQNHPMAPKALIRIFFKFNQNDILESIDAQICYNL